MNIFIFTIGTLGDVQPYIALGKGLNAAGHRVTICTAGRFESLIRSHGLEYGYMNDALLDLIDTRQGRQALEDTLGIFGTLKTMVRLTKRIIPVMDRMFRDCWEAVQGRPCDLIIYHPKAAASVSIAEKLSVPVIMAPLQPMMVPTSEFPLMGLPLSAAGKRVNRWSYELTRLGYFVYTRPVNRFRKEVLGLDHFPRKSGILLNADRKPIPVLHGISPTLVPQPEDWPSTAHICGNWFLGTDPGWQPPAELAGFLDSGEPPVYIGFGSMAGRRPERITRIVIDALMRLNLRGIIATGWGGLAAADLPDTIMKIDHAPHDWLFDRVRAVVHHGGAGTTAAGLRAGKPSFICPFMGDQPFWGDRVYRLGAGPRPVLQKKMTLPAMTAGIEMLTRDAAIQQRAETLGSRIRTEDGVGQTVRIIEEYAGSWM